MLPIHEKRGIAVGIPDRYHKVMIRVLQGANATQVGNEFSLSQNTISSYKTSLRTLLDVPSFQEVKILYLQEYAPTLFQ